MNLFNKENEGENLSDRKLDEIHCRLVLSDLFSGYRHFPASISSMGFFSIAMIINDLIINERKSVIEFGSGLSTILMARLIKKNNLSCKVYSIEHDQKWVSILKGILHDEGTSGYVIPVLAPLSSSSHSKNNLKWYDEGSINQAVPNDTLFDLVIVDGPPAHEKDKKLSRYPVVPFIFNKLHASYSFYLDDAGREGEKKIISLWEEEFKLKFTFVNERFALASNDDFVQYSCRPC